MPSRRLFAAIAHTSHAGAGRRRRALLAVGTALALTALTAGTAPADAATASPPRVGHVFVINLENKGYATTFDASSPAPYLSRTLVAQGALLGQARWRAVFACATRYNTRRRHSACGQMSPNDYEGRAIATLPTAA